MSGCRRAPSSAAKCSRCASSSLRSRRVRRPNRRRRGAACSGSSRACVQRPSASCSPSPQPARATSRLDRGQLVHVGVGRRQAVEPHDPVHDRQRLIQPAAGLAEQVLQPGLRLVLGRQRHRVDHDDPRLTGPRRLLAPALALDHHHPLGLSSRAGPHQVAPGGGSEHPRELELHEHEQRRCHACTVSFRAAPAEAPPRETSPAHRRAPSGNARSQLQRRRREPHQEPARPSRRQRGGAPRQGALGAARKPPLHRRGRESLRRPREGGSGAGGGARGAQPPFRRRHRTAHTPHPLALTAPGGDRGRGRAPRHHAPRRAPPGGRAGGPPGARRATARRPARQARPAADARPADRSGAGRPARRRAHCRQSQAQARRPRQSGFRPEGCAGASRSRQGQAESCHAQRRTESRRRRKAAPKAAARKARPKAVS